jgi:MOSC domain-containing protein YiiM
VIEVKFGLVKNLFLSLKDKAREEKEEISIDDKGILGDKYYAQETQRSILLTSSASYSLAKKSDIDVPIGSLGENILIDLNPYNLSSGDQISIGETVLEITQNCTICNSLAKVDANLPQILKSDRGIFARTLKSGKIRKGDIVNILKY